MPRAIARAINASKAKRGPILRRTRRRARRQNVLERLPSCCIVCLIQPPAPRWSPPGGAVASCGGGRAVVL